MYSVPPRDEGFGTNNELARGFYWKPRLHPGLEPADDVGRVDQAHVLQVGGGQAGLKALRADRDDPLVVVGDRRLVPGQSRVKAPLEDVAIDVCGAGNFALGRTLGGRPDVHQQAPAASSSAA